ncbi:MAG: 7-carboxy-7-deazaguanine synthase QueE [Sphingomonadaceae bacterium]|nr:7-carboxy-7-deazaguanine synthase QueE [Sphingomonadaceae bacterium]
MALVLASVTPGEPEIFSALQGEGPSMGRPSTFIRLSRCNLACEWCDTAYTWRFSGDNRPHRDEETFNRGENQVVLEEEDAAAQIAAKGGNRLIITGGEPLLQAPALVRMLQNLPDLHVEVETNGTVTPPPALDALVDQYNVSPKLSHSGNPAKLALIPERLAAFAVNPRAWFKFVVEEPDDINEVLTLQREYAIPASRIFLMPEGRDSKTLRARSTWISEFCNAHDFNFTDRLHIHLHGDTRGT